jgi:hypothetical protein
VTLIFIAKQFEAPVFAEDFGSPAAASAAAAKAYQSSSAARSVPVSTANRTFALPQARTSSKHGVLKWVLVGAAVAGTAAIVASRSKGKEQESASITFGTPVVGQPQ